LEGLVAKLGLSGKVEIQLCLGTGIIAADSSRGSCWQVVCSGLVRSYLLIDLTLCIKDDVDYVYRIAGNFHMVQIFTFLRGTLVNANKISTKELENLEMALHRLWISALHKLRCMTNIRRALHKYKQQKDRGGDRLRGFLLR